MQAIHRIGAIVAERWTNTEPSTMRGIEFRTLMNDSIGGAVSDAGDTLSDVGSASNPFD